MNPWQPNTSPLDGDTIRAWRKQQDRTDEEYWKVKRSRVGYPTQMEMVKRMGITSDRYRRAERDGVRGCTAALFRLHMETGEIISTIDAPLEYWEALSHHCGSYLAALSFLGLSPVPGTYARWENTGVVRSSYGAGRLLRICWERLNLENTPPFSRRGWRVDRQTKRQIRQMRSQGHTYADIANACGVHWSTARKHGRKS